MARPDLFGHRKFLRLASLLRSRPLAVGVLELLWHGAYSSGDARLGEASVVEFTVSWDGEPGKLAAWLVECGFLDEDAGGILLVHDLEDHAPAYVKKRLAAEERRRNSGETLRDARRRAALTRWEKARQTKVMSEGVSAGLHPDSTCMHKDATPSPSPSPSPSPPHTPLRGARGADPRFDAFFEAFPNRVKRKDAAKAWAALGEDDREAAGAAVGIYAEVWRKAPPDRLAFAGHPATWLRGERWKESRDVWERAAAPRSGGHRAGRFVEPAFVSEGPGFDEVPVEVLS
ncbi:MAG: hypothetical protein ACYDBY_00890 [Thermoanaerobaculia bacterium]